MDEEAWRTRREQIREVARRSVHAARAKVDRGELDFSVLEAQLAHAAQYIERPVAEDAEFHTKEALHAATNGCLDWTSPALRKQAQRFDGIDYLPSNFRVGMILAETVAASRAFAKHQKIVRLEVDALLQCALLATEPPERVTYADVTIPASGFAVSIPQEAFMMSLDPAHAGAEEDRALVATHAFLCAARAPSVYGTAEVVSFLYLEPATYFRLEGCTDAEDTPSDMLIRRYILNLLIYLKAGAASLAPRYAEEIAKIEAVPRKKRRKVQEERLKKLKDDTVFNVTTTLPLDPTIKDFVYEGGLATPAWTLKNRTLVRGHWRNQVCGEGRKDRKLIPIAPHFRGPDLGAQIAATAHTYKVK